jgi:hypothetical protein
METTAKHRRTATMINETDVMQAVSDEAALLNERETDLPADDELFKLLDDLFDPRET